MKWHHLPLKLLSKFPILKLANGRRNWRLWLNPQIYRYLCLSLLHRLKNCFENHFSQVLHHLKLSFYHLFGIIKTYKKLLKITPYRFQDPRIGLTYECFYTGILESRTETGTGLMTSSSRSRRDHPQLYRTKSSTSNQYLKFSKFHRFIFDVVHFVVYNLISEMLFGLVVKVCKF